MPRVRSHAPGARRSVGRRGARAGGPRRRRPVAATSGRGGRSRGWLERPRAGRSTFARMGLLPGRAPGRDGRDGGRAATLVPRLPAPVRWSGRGREPGRPGRPALCPRAGNEGGPARFRMIAPQSTGRRDALVRPTTSKPSHHAPDEPRRWSILSQHDGTACSARIVAATPGRRDRARPSARSPSGTSPQRRRCTCWWSRGAI